MLSELIRAALVGAGFLLIFGLAEIWRSLGNPSAELSRKSVHFTGGLLVLAFPWIFTNRWTVIGLVSVFAFLIWGTERIGLLCGSCSDTHRIGRGSGCPGYRVRYDEVLGGRGPALARRIDIVPRNHVPGRAPPSLADD